MKWETGDIDVVERVNTEKFSKLDNIVIPLRLLGLFFDDVLVDMIVGSTKLYSDIEKTDISFEITNEKLCLIMLLLSGCHKLPDCKMYMETTPDPIQNLIQCLVIHSSVFFAISIFVTTNNLTNKANSRSSFA